MALIRLPALLAREAGGQGRYELDAATLGDALRALPVRDLCLDEHGELRRLVNVFVDGEDVRFGAGLDTPLTDTSQVLVVTAIAGG
ncbi:MAG TPA: MoaD/ThiS family protein [Gaiellaceae bacterium]|nr:MoaD/ThiS family protein [Gaiellaceae bacterium]